MSAKYKSPSFLLPNELNTSANTANDTGTNSLYSMDFDSASSDYIDIGTISSLNAQQNFSISLWFKENVRRTNGFMFSSGTGGSNDISINAANGTLKINVGGTRNVNITSYSSNVWYHVVLTVENTTAKVYLDNGSPTTVTVGSNTSSSSGTLAKIGDLSFASGYYFDGQIDEVAIFNRALNTTEIAALYGGTSPNIYPSNLMATDLNPIAYYPLGEQAQNTGYVGSGDPGNPTTLSNVWQFPNGVLQDYVMDFDGVNDFIDLGNLQPSTTSLSISAWAYKTDTSNASIIGRGSSVDYGIFVYSGSLQFGVNAGGWTTISTTLPVNQWFHVLATWDGTTMKLYVNGGTPVTASKTGTITYTSNNTTIGKNSTLSGFEWDGKISNVAIWNTDQSSNIANIYNNGSPQTTYTVTPQNWWKLNATSVYTPSAPNYTTALDFNGSSDYITVSGGSSLVITGDLTMSMWFKANSFSDYEYILRLTGIQTANQDRMIGFKSSKISTNTFADSSGAYDVLGNTTLSTGVWYQVAVVYSSNTVIIYLNGNADSSSIPTTMGTFTTANPIIGLSYNNNYFDGSISNVAVYNSALTSSQVSTLFNFGTPETNISFSPQAWWKLDDQTAITDSSGNGNTGTNNGATDATTSVAVVPSWKIPSALTVPEHNYLNVLNFNSSQNDYINTASNVGISGSQSRTMSVWLKGGSANNGKSWPMAVAFGANSANKAMWIGGGGSGAAYWYFGWWSTDLATNIRMDADNDWHLLTSVYDGSTQIAKGYIDGVEVISGSRTSINTTDSPLIIGKHLQDSTYWDGPISNVSIWNTALSGPQVSTIYNSGKPETAISFSPIGWWKLDSATITDSAGSNNGTNNGAEVEVSNVIAGNIPVNGVSTTLPSTALQQSDLQFDSPYSNYSLNFDGATYIDCTDNDMFSFGDGGTDSPFSISAWVNFSDVTNSMILSKHTTNQFEYSFLVMSNDKLIFQLNSQLGSNLISRYYNTPMTSYEGQWIHLIGTYDGSSLTSGIKIYLNGTRVDDTDFTSGTYVAMNNGTAPVEIGKRSTDYMNGKIDETAIFNTELTSSQVLEIYNNGRPKDLTTFSGTAPISWWRLGENAYFQDSTLVLPNSIIGAPNGEASTNNLEMISADAPGTYANGIGTNLDILDRVGDAPLSTSNSQSYNMIPSDISPYVPQYVGDQISNTYSMSFNGLDEYFTTGSTFSTFDGLNKLSISMWIKWDNISTGRILASVTRDSNANNFVWMLCNINNHLRFFASNTSEYCYSNYILTANTWTHVAVTMDKTQSTQANKCKIFINGVDETLNNTNNISSSPLQTSNSPLYIGENQNGKYNPMLGEIDEVAIFDKALTADQIKFDLYKPTAEGTNQTADIANNPNLPTPVAWYRMGD